MRNIIMNERLRFSWGHIIAFIALIAVSYASFVGFTYLSGGNFLFGALAMVITDLLFLFVFIGAQQLKATSYHMKKKIKWERALVFASPLIFLAAMIGMSQFWTVHSRNDELVADFNEALEEGKGMFPEYEEYANDRLANYETTLRRVIADKKINPSQYKQAGFTEAIEDIQMENMLEVLQLQLLSSNYDSLQNLAVEWIDNANRGVSAYNVFLLGNTREITKALDNWEGLLTEMTVKKLSNEEIFEPVNDFAYSESKAVAVEKLDNLGKKFSEKKIPTLMAIIFGIVVYLMLIFPYFLQDRHSKSVYNLWSSRKGGGGEIDDAGELPLDLDAAIETLEEKPKEETKEKPEHSEHKEVKETKKESKNKKKAADADNDDEIYPSF